MKKLIAVLLAAMMLLTLGACAKKQPATDLEYIKDKGTLVVGITDFAPMDYKNDAGEWVGFDADMARAFAESLGVKVEFVEIDWDNKVLELDGKSIDCVWNGMTLTDEVTSAMECSNAYCNNAQVVIVPTDKASQYQTVESCAALLSDRPAFFLINSYTTGLAPSVLKDVLRVALPGGHAEADEVGLPVRRDDLVLPCGASGRWIP